MAKIVLSYRRNDSKWITGHLYERLRGHFGEGNVFMDVDNIPVGRDFRKHIRRVLDRCEVVVAVVGPHWLEDAAGNRPIDAKSDWVRLEISEALGREIPVVPLLIDGTKMPKAEHLPVEVQDFAYMQAATFDTEDFRNQIARFIRQLERLLHDIETARLEELPKTPATRAQEVPSPVDQLHRSTVASEPDQSNTRNAVGLKAAEEVSSAAAPSTQTLTPAECSPDGLVKDVTVRPPQELSVADYSFGNKIVAVIGFVFLFATFFLMAAQIGAPFHVSLLSDLR